MLIPPLSFDVDEVTGFPDWMLTSPPFVVAATDSPAEMLMWPPLPAVAVLLTLPFPAVIVTFPPSPKSAAPAVTTTEPPRLLVATVAFPAVIVTDGPSCAKFSPASNEMPPASWHEPPEQAVAAFEDPVLILI